MALVQTDFTLIDNTQLAIIQELRKFFSNVAPYDGLTPFGLVPSDLICKYSVEGPPVLGDPQPGFLQISDEEPQSDQQLPSIILTGLSMQDQPLGFGQRGRKKPATQEVVVLNVVSNTGGLVVDNLGNQVMSNPMTVQYDEYVEAAHMTINFGVRAKTTSQRARLLDLMWLCFADRGFVRGQLELQDIYDEPPFIRINSLNEVPIPSGGTGLSMSYNAELSATFFAQWNRRVVDPRPYASSIIPQGTN
jgi:hypothetical protein